MDPLNQDEEERAPEMRDMRGDGPEAMSVPNQPGQNEKHEHLARPHEPYTDWCEACVVGPGRGAQHRRTKEAKQEVVVQADYQFWYEDNTEAKGGEPGRRCRAFEGK